jgi:hypothetical protein
VGIDYADYRKLGRDVGEAEDVADGIIGEGGRDDGEPIHLKTKPRQSHPLHHLRRNLQNPILPTRGYIGI